jgi:hypothetical protein
VEAAGILHEAFVRSRAFPHVQPRCLYYDLMNAEQHDYHFAVRFNQAKCGGESPSNLLGRFAVVDGHVLWSDTAAGGTLKPLDAFLKRRY